MRTILALLAASSLAFAESTPPTGARLLDGVIDPSENVYLLHTGAQLLDQAIAEPGNWDQMCSFPTVDTPAPIPANGLLVNRQFMLGSDMILRLRARRDDVVAALSARLQEFDVWQKPAPAPPAGSEDAFPPKKSHLSPRSLNGVLLSIADQLQAIEVLPELLRIEEALARGIAAAERDEAAPVPDIGGDASFVISSFRDEPKEKGARRIDLLQCQVVQRELLGLMTALLRREKFPPMLESDMQKRFMDGLRDRAGKDDLAAIKSAGDIPANAKWITFDTSLEMPLARSFVVKIPYSEELRTEIRWIATQFLATVPPAEWKRAAALPEL